MKFIFDSMREFLKTITLTTTHPIVKKIWKAIWPYGRFDTNNNIAFATIRHTEINVKTIILISIS